MTTKQTSIFRLAALWLALTLLLTAAPLSAAAEAASAQWPGFRGIDNNAVTDADTPTTADEAVAKWVLTLKASDDWDTAVSDPVLANDRVYIAVGSKLWKIGPDGQVEKTGALAAAIDYTARLLYVDGKVLVPLPGGRVQALAADTLESVWITDALPDYAQGEWTLAHQTIATLTTADGFVYAGTACADWTTSYYGVIRCIEAATGAVVWTHENTAAGYYWSGAAHFDGYLVIAGDDGVLTSLEAATGRVLSTVELGGCARSTVVRSGSAVFLTTADGVLHRVEVQTDGTFGAHRSVAFGDACSGTPAIHDGSVYVGGLKGEAGVVARIDADTLAVVQTVTAPAYVQASPLVRAGEDGAAFVYFTANTIPGALYVWPVGADAAEALYTPDADAQNYCMASVMAGPDGTLYYTNDSGKLFAVAAQAAEPIDPTDATRPTKPTETVNTTTTVTTPDTVPPTGENEQPLVIGAMLLSAAALAVLCCKRARPER